MRQKRNCGDDKKTGRILLTLQEDYINMLIQRYVIYNRHL